jgi:CO/xanthine dehydrogenase FAD-binding subunit
MNLSTITDIKRPSSADEITRWHPSYAWLAGGTWLFSEPQWATDTLIDLDGLNWPALQATAAGLEIAATCRLAELQAFKGAREWAAVPLITECCNSLLMSFKIWNMASIGGNICMSLPAGAMISLTAALEGVCTLWPRDGSPRQVPVVDFVTGNHANVLKPGELLRSIHLPATALAKRFAFRRASLTHLGRSAALIMGTQSPKSEDMLLTITASVPRPVQLKFAKIPSAVELRRAIDGQVPEDGYFDDVHGSAAYKRHLTAHFCEEIRQELSQAGASR